MNILIPPPALSKTDADIEWARQMVDIGKQPQRWTPTISKTGTLVLTSHNVTDAFYGIKGCEAKVFIDAEAVIAAGATTGQLVIPNPFPYAVLINVNMKNRTVIGGVEEDGWTQVTKGSPTIISFYRQAFGAFAGGQSVVIRAMLHYLVKSNNPGVFT